MGYPPEGRTEKNTFAAGWFPLDIELKKSGKKRGPVGLLPTRPGKDKIFLLVKSFGLFPIGTIYKMQAIPGSSFESPEPLMMGGCGDWGGIPGIDGGCQGDESQNRCRGGNGSG
jgi:hypothetical protein